MTFEMNIETIIICCVIFVFNKIYTDYQTRQNWNLFFNSINTLSNYSNLVKNVVEIRKYATPQTTPQTTPHATPVPENHSNEE